jgi:hypothetical protein
MQEEEEEEENIEHEGGNEIKNLKNAEVMDKERSLDKFERTIERNWRKNDGMEVENK